MDPVATLVRAAAVGDAPGLESAAAEVVRGRHEGLMFDRLVSVTHHLGVQRGGTHTAGTGVVEELIAAVLRWIDAPSATAWVCRCALVLHPSSQCRAEALCAAARAAAAQVPGFAELEGVDEEVVPEIFGQLATVLVPPGAKTVPDDADGPGRYAAVMATAAEADVALVRRASEYHLDGSLDDRGAVLAYLWRLSGPLAEIDLPLIGLEGGVASVVALSLIDAVKTQDTRRYCEVFESLFDEGRRTERLEVIEATALVMSKVVLSRSGAPEAEDWPGDLQRVHEVLRAVCLSSAGPSDVSGAVARLSEGGPAEWAGAIGQLLIVAAVAVRSGGAFDTDGDGVAVLVEALADQDVDRARRLAHVMAERCDEPGLALADISQALEVARAAVVSLAARREVPVGIVLDLVCARFARAG